MAITWGEKHSLYSEKPLGDPLNNEILEIPRNFFFSELFYNIYIVQ
jgi:hypothetical protein